MAERGYEVLLTGELAPGVDRIDATNALAALMKLPVERVALLLSQGPVSVKRQVDTATAQRYKERIEQTGVLWRGAATVGSVGHRGGRVHGRVTPGT